MEEKLINKMPFSSEHSTVVWPNFFGLWKRNKIKPFQSTFRQFASFQTKTMPTSWYTFIDCVIKLNQYILNNLFQCFSLFLSFSSILSISLTHASKAFQKRSFMNIWHIWHFPWKIKRQLNISFVLALDNLEINPFFRLYEKEVFFKPEKLLLLSKQTRKNLFAIFSIVRRSVFTSELMSS